MNNYQVMYEGVRRKVEASNHIAARALASAWFRKHAESFDASFLAVVDIDESGYGKHTGHCQGCSPNEMCSRSGTCGWCDERYEPAPGESVWHAIQQCQLDTVHEIWSRRASDYKR